MSRGKEHDYDAIVIGSGVGGLGAAALLAEQGQRVAVFERHTAPGGLTHTFRRRGFEWDVGVHYVGQVQEPDRPLRRVFDRVTGGALGWASLGPIVDRIVFPDAAYDLVAGRGPLEEALGRSFPRERRALGRYLDRIGRIASSAERYFLERALPGPLGALLWPFLGTRFRREAARTTADALASWFADPRLRGVLAARWGNHGSPPATGSFAMHALVEAAFLDGASYPIGGSARIASAMIARISALGGSVRCGAPVAGIVVRGGRAIGVRLAEGDTVTAANVISDAGVHRTMGELIPPEHRPPGLARRIAAIPPSSGHVALYLGLDGDGAELGLDPIQRWIHPSDDHDRNLRLGWQGPQPPLPFVYLSSPSAKDPDWASRHPGRSTVVAISPAPYERFRRWADRPWRRRGAEYEDEKARIAERMLAAVLQELPRLRGRIVWSELSTPLSTEHFTGRPAGAMYGLDHGPRRFAERGLRAASPLPGLWWVGQDLTTVGVGSALMSSVLTASSLLRRDLLGPILRGAPDPLGSGAAGPVLAEPSS